jgi:uncharacterized protein YggU (UPF0235/DUF167 family)
MIIRVIVHPNSKNPRIEKDLTQITHVYVREPAIEGRANKAVIEALSELHNVPKSKIILKSGFKSKVKTFEIVQMGNRRKVDNREK